MAPELRTPLTWLPLAVAGPVTLSIGRRLFGGATEVVDGVDVERAVDVPAFVYRSTGRTTPTGALVWMHGGGLIFGTAKADHELCSTIARDLEIVVVSVDYRLAPEDTFPAGLDDCHSALTWLHAHAEELGVDPSRVAVGGASAGGGLAAALAQRAYDDELAVAFQLLEYPMLDDRTALRSDHEGRDRLAWTPRSNRFAWTCYLGRPPVSDQAATYAAAARRVDLAGLPPAWIGVGDLDLFLPEDLDYAERLRAAGVPCETHVVPRMQHGADVRLSEDTPLLRSLRASMMGALARSVGSQASPR